MNKKRIYKALVIDVNVASSANDQSEHPQAYYCADFLTITLVKEFNIVCTPEIEDEWNNNFESRFLSRWRSGMKSAGLIMKKDSPKNEILRKKLHNSTKKNSQVVMSKDYHLVEAALITGYIIISLENNSRKHFSIAAQKVGEIKELMWVNPEKVDEKAIEWLENGAPVENERYLVNYDDKKSFL